MHAHDLKRVHWESSVHLSSKYFVQQRERLSSASAASTRLSIQRYVEKLASHGRSSVVQNMSSGYRNLVSRKRIQRHTMLNERTRAQRAGAVVRRREHVKIRPISVARSWRCIYVACHDSIRILLNAFCIENVRSDSHVRAHVNHFTRPPDHERVQCIHWE